MMLAGYMNAQERGRCTSAIVERKFHQVQLLYETAIVPFH